MKGTAILLVIVLFFLMPTAVAAAECQFVLGFKTLRDLIGQEIVGACLENEHYNAIGDSVQQTTGGLLVWRKADNWTAFTDGYRTWIHGPNGLEQRLNTELFSWEVEHALEALPWVRDGVRDSVEHTAVRALWGVSGASPQVFWELLRKPWLQSESLDVSGVNVGLLLTRMESIVLSDEVAARRIAQMPYMETIAVGAENALQDLMDLMLSDPEVAAIAVTATNALTIGALRDLERNSNQLLQALARKTWVQDGLSLDEEPVIRDISDIARWHPALALSILNMPFLDHVDAADAAAMDSLRRLQSQSDSSDLLRILSHPTLRGGVTDATRSRVAVLPMADEKRTGLRDALLDPAQFALEERLVALPLAGEVLLVVVHASPGVKRTMEILEYVVREQETFMQEAFPTKYIVLLIADASDLGGGWWGYGRANLDRVSGEDVRLIGHEIGHAYWGHGMPGWISEGGAEVMGVVVSQKVPLRILVSPPDDLCHLTDNLAELNKISYEGTATGIGWGSRRPLGSCEYTLGLQLFVELNFGLGDLAFRQGFRRLHLKLRDKSHDDECTGLERGICYVNAAFVTDASPEAAAIAKPIINLWYYGSEHGPQ